MQKQRVWVTGLAVVVGVVSQAAHGGILSAKFYPGDTIDLTKVGTVDWCVFRIANPEKISFEGGEWKSSGMGVGRWIDTKGDVKRARASVASGVGWGWGDGFLSKSGTHQPGQPDETGMRIWLGPKAAVVFEFSAPPRGKKLQAHVIAECEAGMQIVARQQLKRTEQVKEVATFGEAKQGGIATVVFDGDALTIELVNAGEGVVSAGGFAAALSKPTDYPDGVPRIATLVELAAGKVSELGEIDFLQVASDFADCMVKYGRDRYGRVQSPLFAVLLLREREPKIGPQPVFARNASSADAELDMEFKHHDYTRCLNYPPGLGPGGPNQVTLSGCDPGEDRSLYEMLIDLSRATGNPVYKQEAEKAIDWWFANTQAPFTGLYPWGSQMGWDFEFDCPSYFEGPSQYLHGACYHEVRDSVPFLDRLTALPAQEGEFQTPLERYAAGIWQNHYWHRKKAIYCRFGDYNGEDKRLGSYAGYPAHQAAHLQLWVRAYMTTQEEEFKEELTEALNVVLDAQIARAKKYGFVPLTFDVDYRGKPAGQVSGQALLLARRAAELSVEMEKGSPEIAARLVELARLHLGDEKVEQIVAPAKRGPQDEPEHAPVTGDKPPAEIASLANANMPGAHVVEIIRRLQWYSHYHDNAYLDAAVRQARVAYALFMDDVCPLPKYNAGPPLTTTEGKPFPSFYFRGASLMQAFALVGEAQRDNKPK